MRPSARDRLRYVENYLILARRQMEDNRTQEAYASLQRALRLAPSHVEALSAMGRLLYQEGRYEEAEPYLERWRAADGSDPEACFLLGNLCLSTERPQLAAEYYQQAIKLGDDTPDVTFNLGLACYMMHRMEDAERLFRQAVAAAPGYGRALDGLGCVALHRGHTEAAIALFRQAIAADPTLGEAREHLAQVYLEQDRLESARQALSDLSEGQSLSVRGWYLLGMIQLRAGNHLGAIHPLRQAARLDPGNVEILSLLATCYRHTGQLEQALAAAEGVLAINADNPQALLVRAQAHWAQGRVEEARGDLTRAHHLDPENREIAEALYTLLREQS